MQSVRNFASIGKISIVGTLDVDNKASRMVCSVVAGSFLSTNFSSQISVDLRRDLVNRNRDGDGDGNGDGDGDEQENVPCT